MATATDVRGKLKNGVGFAKKLSIMPSGGHCGRYELCALAWMKSGLLILVLAQHPCWTVALEDSWQPICLLGPCPRTACAILEDRCFLPCVRGSHGSLAGHVAYVFVGPWLFSSPEHSLVFPIRVSQIAIHETSNKTSLFFATSIFITIQHKLP